MEGYPEIFRSVRSISLQNSTPRELMKAQPYESFKSRMDLATTINPKGKLLPYAGNRQYNLMDYCPVCYFPHVTCPLDSMIKSKGADQLGAASIQDWIHSILSQQRQDGSHQGKTNFTRKEQKSKKR